MANVTVARSTNQAITEQVLVREVGDQIAELEPDVAPLLVFSTKAKRKRATYSPRIEKIEDELRNLWGYHNAAAIDSVNTQVLVNDGTLFAANDLVAVLRTDAAGGVEEIVRVTAVNGNTLTVVRGVGGFQDTISQTNALRIVGSAYAEGAGLGSVRSTTKTIITSYTQIFREPVSVTGTMQASNTYGGDDEDYQLQKALKEHKKQIEAAGLWGRASESLSSPGTIRTTMGFKSRVTTNVTDVNTTLTLRIMNTFSASAFRYGADTKLFIAAPKYIEAITFFSQNKLLTEVQQTIFGVKISQLILPHGTLLLARNWLMEDGVSGQPGYDDEAYAVDMGAIEYRFLSWNGKSRDTALMRDRKKDGTDGETHEYLSEVGWVVAQEKRHARMLDCSDYS